MVIMFNLYDKRLFYGKLKTKDVSLLNLVKIHYHFVDWDRAYKKHAYYAVRNAYEMKAGRDQFLNIVNQATARLNEDGMVLKPVEEEWGVIKV